MTPEKKLLDAEAAALLAELEQVGSLEELRTATRQPPGRALGLDPAALTHRQRIAGRIFRDCSQSPGQQAAKELLRELPAAGTILHAILPGTFTPLDLVPAVLELANATAKEVHLSTLGFSSANVQTLCALLDSKAIRALSLVCSRYFAAASKEIFTTAERELPPRGARLIATRSHCKVMLLQLTNGDRWVVEGSGNLRSCVCLEQVSLCNDPALYRFHRTWLRRVLSEKESR
jgi:hypothetical protein